ncbi:hypothetical protein O6H91_06G124400 [Diphasiastrum complanatum]|uniref:Uncharacterized protein n=5 Tax=Diphasiastrum complanatum TaxID=34168 RepID=A0ACC2DIR3_DIPCM|nr:hypothetical protein O6H91_06G124400 [Diphasiastrum complanatum]KAJ7554088.1 hypothetical protein O6H91_06G124400 [Diphasiastrum complanatum]KAJ7554089.1 hypothetical protein O6H91_06G124400 [Diphasiastrum complanatum]KAJ7554091.1 hypothetical protein O6H91_06G124400 [Diphasiastrum complanatum]KAJ7554092.1 hypothetical protein O6H91_06G124400 [Diphasiastrum complanatum]
MITLWVWMPAAPWVWWIIGLLLCSPTSSQTDATDFAVLQSFVSGLSNPQLLNWKGTDPCGGNWPHIQCEGSHVTAIAVEGVGLKGTLPSNLNQLSNLRYLGLQDNFFHGALPSLNGLGLLQTAYLNNNNFDTIPADFFKSLTSLTAIYLDHSNLNGTNGWVLQRDLLESPLLMNLSLTNTTLSGTIPSFLGSMPNLRVLNLAYNKLGGGIPPSFQNSNLVQLQVNNMIGPVLTGPIDVLGSMSSLTELWLQVNGIEGIIPVGLSNAFSLQNLKINDNKLAGPIPFNFTSLPLRVFTFDNNQLIGPIPNFPIGVSIASFGNNFCQSTAGLGCAPEVNALLSFIGDVGYPLQIISSWKGNNPCNGWIGVACNAAGHVSVINLVSYQLSGVISPALANLTFLTVLRLSNNQLTGIIPSALASLKSLRLLDLSNNTLSGTPPKFPSSTTVNLQGNPELTSNLVPSSSPPLPTPVSPRSQVASTASPTPFPLPATVSSSPPPFRPPSPPSTVPLPSPPIPLPTTPVSPAPIVDPTLPVSANPAPQSSAAPTSSQPSAGNAAPWNVFPLDGPVPSSGRKKIAANSPGANPPRASGPASVEGSHKSSSTVGVIVGSIAGVLTFSLIAIVSFCLYKRKSGPYPRIAGQDVMVYNRNSSSDPEMVKGTGLGSILTSNGRSSEADSNVSSVSGVIQGLEGGKLAISIQSLRHATNDFGTESIIGRGGFGVVYKGVLEDGTVVAVKRMVAAVVNSTGQNEFQAEIAVLTKVRHRHLVALLGYCIDGFEKLLVYEYMPNGNLSQHLLDKGKLGWKPLNWSQRLSVALDVARAMEYLHLLAHKSFIHRDLKSSNILLDDKFRAKVSDFGLVKLAPEGKHSIETKLAGTFGYLAPEYAVTGRVTTKADVFSFGVVLMELITGRRALDETETEENVHLVTWFRRKNVSQESLRALVDPLLDVSKDAFESISTVTELAGHCTAHEPYQRPDMGHAVNVLAPLVGQWKPMNLDDEITTGIDLNMTLPQALKKWQDVEDSSLLFCPDNSQRSR